MAVEGYVYVLHNCEHRQPSVKIGSTESSVEGRARRLDTTGSPGAFTVVFKVLVTDCRLVERLTHQQLAQYRVRRRREFFAVGPDLAIRTVLEVAAPHLIEPVAPGHSVDVLAQLDERYGGLLDPALKRAVIEARSGTVVLSCTFRRFPHLADETIESTDLSIIDADPYEFDPFDLEAAVQEFLALDPYTYIMVTPLFAEPEAKLIDYLCGEGITSGGVFPDQEATVQQIARRIRLGEVDADDELLIRFESGEELQLTDALWQERWSGRSRG